jgi:hypothetical protein
LTFGIDDRRGAIASVPLEAIIDVVEPLASSKRFTSNNQS